MPTEVGQTVAVLERAAGPVAPDRVSALARADVRRYVEQQLAAAGRVLVEHARDGTVIAYASGYDDQIAGRLATEGLGVLDRFDQAVVALVLLHTVAVPATRGRMPVPWSSAPGVSYKRLFDARRFPNGAVRDAVSRLDAAGILTNARASGIRPGPALDRLTDRQRRTVEARLVAAVAPDDPVVARLAARADLSPTTSDPYRDEQGRHDG